MVTQLLNDQCDSSTAGLTLGLAFMASWFIQGHPLIGSHSDLGGRPGGPPVLPLLAERGCRASSPSADGHTSARVQGWACVQLKLFWLKGLNKYQALTTPFVSMVS